MGRMYSATFTAVAVTAAQDLFEIVAPADAVVVLHSLYLGQSTELGDAAEEQLRVAIKSGQTTSGSGGSTVTPAPLALGDAAFGGTVEANNTTKASTGTIVTHHADSWNVRGPYQLIFTPETRKVLSPSARMTVELVAAPADSITLEGTVYFEEIGG